MCTAILDCGWWFGRIGTTRQGYFPSNYTEVVLPSCAELVDEPGPENRPKSPSGVRVPVEKWAGDVNASSANRDKPGMISGVSMSQRQLSAPSTRMFQSFSAAPGQVFEMDAWSRHFSGDALAGSGAPNSCCSLLATTTAPRDTLRRPSVIPLQPATAR